MFDCLSQSPHKLKKKVTRENGLFRIINVTIFWLLKMVTKGVQRKLYKNETKRNSLNTVKVNTHKNGSYSDDARLVWYQQTTN